MIRTQWRLVLSALAVLLLGPGLALGDAPAEAKTAFKAAREARRAGKLDEAARQLKEYRRLAGSDDALRLEEALLRAQRGDVAPVEKQLRALALKKDAPDAVFALEVLTAGHFAALRFGEALPYLKRWLEVKPPDAQGYYLRGRAQELAPAKPDNWGRPVIPPGAVEDYRRVVQADPKHAPARMRLAVALLDQGKPREAETLFRALVKEMREGPGALLGLARCHVALGKLEEARALLDRLLEKHPTHVEGLVERARLALNLGKPDEATAFTRKALAAKPADRQALYVLQLCLNQTGRAAEARAVLERLKQTEAALKRLERIVFDVMAKGTDAGLRHEAGALLLRLGEDKEALRWFDSALRLDAKHRPTHKALADYYKVRGKKDLAEKHHRLAGD